MCLRQTNGSLLNKLNDVARTDGQPNTTLCQAMNWARHTIEGVIGRFFLYSNVSVVRNVALRNTYVC